MRVVMVPTIHQRAEAFGWGRNLSRADFRVWRRSAMQVHHIHVCGSLRQNIRNSIEHIDITGTYSCRLTTTRVEQRQLQRRAWGMRAREWLPAWCEVNNAI